MITHLVIVADAARARLFTGDDVFGDWTTVECLDHPAGHLKTADLVSGKRGSIASSASGTRSAYDRHTDPHRSEMAKFAAIVAEHAERLVGERRIDRLVLCAPPRFLGLLREALPKQLERRVVASFPGEWTLTPDAELPAILRARMPVDAGLPPEM